MVYMFKLFKKKIIEKKKFPKPLLEIDLSDSKINKIIKKHKNKLNRKIFLEDLKNGVNAIKHLFYKDNKIDEEKVEKYVKLITKLINEFDYNNKNSKMFFYELKNFSKREKINEKQFEKLYKMCVKLLKIKENPYFIINNAKSFKDIKNKFKILKNI